MAEHASPVSGIAQADWHRTPTAVQEFVRRQQQQLETLEKRLEQLEARLNQNSTNSSKPPSSDNSYQKPNQATPPGPAGQTPGKAGGEAGASRPRPAAVAADGGKAYPAQPLSVWEYRVNRPGRLSHASADRTARDSDGGHPLPVTCESLPGVWPDL